MAAGNRAGTQRYSSASVCPVDAMPNFSRLHCFSHAASQPSIAPAREPENPAPAPQAASPASAASPAPPAPRSPGCDARLAAGLRAMVARARRAVAPPGRQEQAAFRTAYELDTVSLAARSLADESDGAAAPLRRRADHIAQLPVEDRAAELHAVLDQAGRLDDDGPFKVLSALSSQIAHLPPEDRLAALQAIAEQAPDGGAHGTHVLGMLLNEVRAVPADRRLAGLQRIFEQTMRLQAADCAGVLGEVVAAVSCLPGERQREAVNSFYGDTPFIDPQAAWTALAGAIASLPAHRATAFELVRERARALQHGGAGVLAALARMVDALPGAARQGAMDRLLAQAAGIPGGERAQVHAALFRAGRDLGMLQRACDDAGAMGGPQQAGMVRQLLRSAAHDNDEHRRSQAYRRVRMLADSLGGADRGAALASLSTCLHLLPQAERQAELDAIYRQAAQLEPAGMAAALAGFGQGFALLPREQTRAAFDTMRAAAAHLQGARLALGLDALSRCIHRLPGKEKHGAFQDLAGAAGSLAGADLATVLGGLAASVRSLPEQHRGSAADTIRQRAAALRGEDLVPVLGPMAESIEALPASRREPAFDFIRGRLQGLEAEPPAQVLLELSRCVGILPPVRRQQAFEQVLAQSTLLPPGSQPDILEALAACLPNLPPPQRLAAWDRLAARAHGLPEHDRARAEEALEQVDLANLRSNDLKALVEAGQDPRYRTRKALGERVAEWMRRHGEPSEMHGPAPDPADAGAPTGAAAGANPA